MGSRLFGCFKSTLRKRDKRRLEIILYHFVSDDLNDFTLSGHTVKTDAFRQQLLYLSDHYHIIPLGKVPELMSGKTKAEGPFASICFDDGYRSNLTEAYPILNALRIPATVFICSSTIDNRDILWRDKIRFLIQNNLADDFIAYLKKDNTRNRYRFGRLEAKSFYTWSKDLKSISDMSIQKDVSNYLEYRRIDLSQTAAHHNLFMKRSDIKKYDYLEFGNHTRSHPIMTCLNHQEQFEEIVSTHRYLKGAGVESVGLAMPFSPYNNDTLDICHQIGYNLVLTFKNQSNPVHSDAKKDIYILYRRMAPEDLKQLAQII
jgi:peptidoglycan/xylan/chitin deacetylase (PgdA/CDA1 family)